MLPLESGYYLKALACVSAITDKNGEKVSVITETFINKSHFLTIMEDILKRWNLWWETRAVPKTSLGIKRETILQEIMPFLKAKEILCLVGVRRSGKSTIMFQLIGELLAGNVNPANIMYFNLDEPLETKNYEVLEKIFKTFVELNNPKGRKYIFLDEIQNIELWEKWLKKYYDLYGEDIKFIITGSNSSLLSDKLARLLTGRMFTKTIFPLSFKEYLMFNKIYIENIQKEVIMHHLNTYLQKGGFPEVVLEHDEEVNKKRLAEYFNSILLRDIIQSRNIRESAKLIELSIFSVTNISSLFSYNKISKSIGLKVDTVKEYLSYLEEAFLIFQSKFFSYSLKESIFILKPRKIYAIDNGLRNAVSFRFSKDYGKLAENLVFIELKRRGADVCYWKENGEIDFIVKDKNLTAINVTYADEINEREISSLNEFKKAKRRIIITKNLSKKEKGIEFVPLWKWLLE